MRSFCKATFCPLLAAVLLAAAVCACAKPGLDQTLPRYASFWEIPGVTADEIRDIEALQGQTRRFVYGMPLSTEAFLDENGKVGGFTALFCEWLTELFGISFEPVLYEWADLLAGLESGEVDFSGELTATPARLQIYYMTEAIAERVLKYYCLADTRSLDEITQSRLLRCAFIEGTNTINTIVAELEPGTFEVTLLADVSQVYGKLRSGEIDAFFYSGTTEINFDEYSDVVAREFYPLIYRPVSLSTHNPALQPVISVVQKMLESGGIRYLTGLYNAGQREYMKHKLFMRLSDEERAYIATHPVVPVAADSGDYPVGFYDTREKSWQGIFFDLLGEVSLLTGLEFRRANDQHTQWSRIIEMLESGEVAFVPDLTQSKELEGHFIWSDAAILNDYYTLISRSNYRSITFNDILHVRVGTGKNTPYIAMLRYWFPNHLNTVEYETVEDAFSALQRGEVDMVMASQKRLLQLTNYQELAGFRANIVFDRVIETRLGFNRDETILCSIMDKALQLVDTKAISDQWMRKTYDYREMVIRSRLPWLIGAAILLLLVLLLLSALFMRNRGEEKRLEELVRNRTAALEKQHRLMHLVNETADILLETDARDYLNAIVKSMGMICRAVDVDRLYLWQNSRNKDGDLLYRQVCKYDHGDFVGDGGVLEFLYRNSIPVLEKQLSRGESVNESVSGLPEKERMYFTAHGVLSVLIVPLFIKDEFWGCVSFNSCSKDRFFDSAEKHLLRSWGLLAIGAIQRGRIALNMYHTLTKLEAVMRNYKGVIWSVDSNRTITTFNGQYVKAIGMEPSELEGKNSRDQRITDWDPNIADYVEKTFSEGPQGWTSNMGDVIFRSYTTPMLDEKGRVVGVVGSTDDVTELVKLHRDLKSAVEAANAASDTKSRFLANMSHEMRTPLNAIIGLSDLELGASRLEGDSLSNIEKIHSAGMNLLGLINDLLDISKIESGKLVLVPSVYDFPNMINDVISQNIVRIGGKPIEFRLHVDESLPFQLEGDELRVKQIYNNLLSNAFKYTYTGYVDWTLSCTREGDQVKVTSIVRDTGIGIGKDDIEKLFKDYYQANIKAHYYIEGTGLGLSITRNLTRLMGGEISVQSEEGKGSAFIAEFYQKAAGGETIGSETAENLSQFRYSAQHRSRNEKFVRADMSYASVLVVDDVVINLEVAMGMFKPYNIDVDCAMSGQEAVDLVRGGEVRYSAIFMDHMMPGMDGIEAAKIIRSEIDNDYAKQVPIIALTANAIVGSEAMFLKNGFQAFLSKPIDMPKLDQVLNEWVRDKKKEVLIREMTALAASDSPQVMRIPGLNAVIGFAHVDNNEESYLLMLKSFVTNAPGYITNARTEAEAKNFDAYRIAVHSLKVACRNIGAGQLGDMAEELKVAAMEKDADTVSADTGAFADAAEKLVGDITSFLQTLPGKP